MRLQLRKSYSKILLPIIFLIACFFSIASGSQIRSSVTQESSFPFWVAVDFKVGNDAHITAPVGKGVSSAPSFSWKNVEVLRTVWPDPVTLPPDGVFKGYDKDFSVLFLISPLVAEKSIVCDVFYVICDNACRPIQASLPLEYDGKLTKPEIREAEKSSSVSYDLARFFMMLGMAFIGGIILNCMPCVFPVLSIKIFKILKDYSSGRSSIKKQGVSFALGVITTFLSIGLFMFYMKQMGSSIGWGFYMQNTMFVLCLLIVFLVCALYFFGFIFIPSFNFPSEKKHSLCVQSFLNGIFTTFASSICVGPFVGIAIGAALVYNSVLMSASVFMALGLGVAFPFMCVCFVPQFGKILPKPGRWMENLKEFMGFAMIFSSLWVLWILSSQISVFRLMVIMASSIGLAMSIWGLHKAKDSKFWKILSVVGVVISVLSMFNECEKQSNAINWTNFSLKKIESLRKSNKPVFVNVTASWCVTCGINSLVFGDNSVVEAFKKCDVQAVQADWTKEDRDITKFLSMYESNSIPFNVLYKPGVDKPVIFSTLLSSDDLIHELGK